MILYADNETGEWAWFGPALGLQWSANVLHWSNENSLVVADREFQELYGYGPGKKPTVAASFGEWETVDTFAFIAETCPSTAPYLFERY